MPDSIGMSSSTRKASSSRPRSPPKIRSRLSPNEKKRVAGIALTASSTAQLVVDPAGLMPFGAYHMQATVAHAGPASPPRRTQPSPGQWPRKAWICGSSGGPAAVAIRSSSSITLRVRSPRPSPITGQLTQPDRVLGGSRDKGFAAAGQCWGNVVSKAAAADCAEEAPGVCDRLPVSPGGPATLPATSNGPCSRCCLPG